MSRPDQTKQKGDGCHEEERLRSPRPRGNGTRRAHQPIRRVQVRVPQGRRAKEQMARQQAGRGHVRSDIQVQITTDTGQEGSLYTTGITVGLNFLSGTRNPENIARQKLYPGLQIQRKRSNSYPRPYVKYSLNL